MNTLFDITYYSFLFSSVAAFIAVLYFFAQFPRVDRTLRILVSLNILICGIASAQHLYYFMALQPIVSSGAEPMALARSFIDLPLYVRYADWLITTVLAVVMFPILIGIERVGSRFLVNLAVADGVMISAGYIGEQSMIAAGTATPLSFLCFGIGVSLWLYMLVSIYRVLRRLPSGELIPAQRDTLGYMFFFISIGWTIYPAGYFHAVIFDQGVGLMLREFTFNLGDIVNKIIWGLLVIHAAREVSRAAREEVKP